MKFVSTRDKNNNMVSLSQAVLKGLADDGGLFFPVDIPNFSLEDISKLKYKSFPLIASEVFKRFTDEFSEAEILNSAELAYSKNKFSADDVAPIRKLDENLFLLELFNGPTGAFKDFALQFLPRLMTLSIDKQKSSDKCILVATSGDTGGAAIHGFSDVPKTKALAFFPENGVSFLQKMQMQCFHGNNIASVATTGDFDMVQSNIKSIFSDKEFTNLLKDNFNIELSSANSINIGRLLPQIFYVFSLYIKLLEKENIELGEKIDIIVPTGNFGNIFSVIMAKKMGLPIDKLICANNINNTSSEFIQSGVFDIRDRKTKRTFSPAMDILRASNLERMLFMASGFNCEKNKQWQDNLVNNGSFEVDNITKKFIDDHFDSLTVDDNDTACAIRTCLDRYDFLLDPHTAVGFSAWNKIKQDGRINKKTVIFSTAHFGKFSGTVCKSLGLEMYKNEKENLFSLNERAKSPAIPDDFFNILSTKKSCEYQCSATIDDMKEAILSFLKKFN